MMRNRRSRSQRRSIWLLLVLLLFLSSLFGWGLAAIAQGQSPPANQISNPSSTLQPVDALPQNLKLGQELYLKNCSSCHFAIPPQVLPVQTWQILLQDPKHYGATLNLPVQPELSYIWDYIQTFSRPVNLDEDIPYRVAKSRYFKILHPRVEFPQPVTLSTCVTCHPGVKAFNFRDLTPDWQDAP